MVGILPVYGVMRVCWGAFLSQWVAAWTAQSEAILAVRCHDGGGRFCGFVADAVGWFNPTRATLSSTTSISTCEFIPVSTMVDRIKRAVPRGGSGTIQ